MANSVGIVVAVTVQRDVNSQRNNVVLADRFPVDAPSRSVDVDALTLRRGERQPLVALVTSWGVPVVSRVSGVP